MEGKYERELCHSFLYLTITPVPPELPFQILLSTHKFDTSSSNRKAFEIWRKNPDITILGNHNARRLPIFSMLIRHQDSGKMLHHNFVSVLLNDLYGIQARGGCACAGPYAQVRRNQYSKPDFKNLRVHRTYKRWLDSNNHILVYFDPDAFCPNSKIPR